MRPHPLARGSTSTTHPKERSNLEVKASVAHRNGVVRDHAAERVTDERHRAGGVERMRGSEHMIPVVEARQAPRFHGLREITHVRKCVAKRPVAAAQPEAASQAQARCALSKRTAPRRPANSQDASNCRDRVERYRCEIFGNVLLVGDSIIPRDVRKVDVDAAHIKPSAAQDLQQPPQLTRLWLRSAAVPSTGCAAAQAGHRSRTFFVMRLLSWVPTPCTMRARCRTGWRRTHSLTPSTGSTSCTTQCSVRA